MKKDLNINPRLWTREDVEAVREIASSKVTELFPECDGCSPTYCQILPHGALWVWFYFCGMEKLFVFPAKGQTYEEALCPCERWDETIA